MEIFDNQLNLTERIRELERSHQELRNQFALNYNAQSQIAIDRIIEALYLTKVSRQDNSSCVDIIITLQLLIEKLQGD